MPRYASDVLFPAFHFQVQLSLPSLIRSSHPPAPMVTVLSRSLSLARNEEMKCLPALVILLSMLCMTFPVAATSTASTLTSPCGFNCSAPSNKASRSPPPPASEQLCGKGHGSCSTPGYCCSSSGTCGYDDAHCVGCQKDYGRCPTLCDSSRPCGTYGMVSYVVSIVSMVLFAIGTAAQVYLAAKGNPENTYTIIGFVIKKCRHR